MDNCIVRNYREAAAVCDPEQLGQMLARAGFRAGRLTDENGDVDTLVGLGMDIHARAAGVSMQCTWTVNGEQIQGDTVHCPTPLAALAYHPDPSRFARRIGVSVPAGMTEVPSAGQVALPGRQRRDISLFDAAFVVRCPPQRIGAVLSAFNSDAPAVRKGLADAIDFALDYCLLVSPGGVPVIEMENILRIASCINAGASPGYAHGLPEGTTLPHLFARVAEAVEDTAEQAEFDAYLRALEVMADPRTVLFDLNTPDSTGRTALHHAACHGVLDVCRILAAGGADPLRPDAAGATSASLARALPDGDEIAGVMQAAFARSAIRASLSANSAPAPR